MDDHQKQVFHSSNIADKTLAGAVSDPFTLTDKEKKKLIQQEKRVEQKALRTEQRLRKKAEFHKKLEQIKIWQKKHRFFFATISVSVFLVLGFGIFSLTNYIVSTITKHNPSKSDQIKADIDQSDPISVRCQCAKNSDLYKQLKDEDEASKNYTQQIISDFDPKTAMPSRCYQFIYSIFGTNLARGNSNNTDLQTTLDNLNKQIESHNITDQGRLRLLKLYSINAYLDAKDYDTPLSLLGEYNEEELTNGEKSIYYNILYKIYTATGNKGSAKKAADIINSIPDEPFQS